MVGISRKIDLFTQFKITGTLVDGLKIATENRERKAKTIHSHAKIQRKGRRIKSETEAKKAEYMFSLLNSSRPIYRI